jgi:hypothetical protein
MLYLMLAACATLILVLAVPRAAEARRLACHFRAQEEWAELMDGHTLIFVLAVPHAAEARLARLFRAQEEWAEMTVPAEGLEFSPDFNA